MQTQVHWVTGAGGFIGSQLTNGLADKGFEVVGFGRNKREKSGCHHFVNGDISKESFDYALSEFGQPVRVYHLAGGPTVGQSIADPLRDFVSNVQTTAILFDALRRHKLDSLVVLASSAAVYGSGYLQPISIDAAKQPRSPYGHHKIMAENIARYYAETYAHPSTILRLFSVYGAGLEKQLLYDICTRLQAGEHCVTLGGTGDEVRDWCHIGDVVSAMISLESPVESRHNVFNVGSGTGTCIKEIAEGIANCWGGAREIRFSGVTREGDPHSLVACPTSLPADFSPAVDIAAGIREFVQHFKQQYVKEQ